MRRPVDGMARFNNMSTAPNVVFYFTDQQRFDSVGLGGNPLGLTPNFDRLARQGTHVRHCFSPTPICGPCRACVQTGTWYTRNGVYRNGTALPQQLPTMADAFNQAGYMTSYIGKWHLAGQDQPHGPVAPERRGGYQRWLGAEVLELVSHPYDTRLWDADGNEHRLPGYRVDAMTDAAIRELHHLSRQDQPFFLFLSQLEPHHQNDADSCPPPRVDIGRYDGAWTPPDLAALPTHPSAQHREQSATGGSASRQLGGYWGMVKRLDESLGRIHDALVSLGLEDNTIVVFTSDHGCHFKTRDGAYKRTCHESSIRVPCMISGGPFAGGGDLPNLVSLIDLPPTLLDACGIDVPPSMQGRSLLPVLTDHHASWPDDAYVQVGDGNYGRAIRTQRWKYCVMATDNDHAQANGGVTHRYTEAFLYDLENDPYELSNLIRLPRYESVRQEMRQRLAKRLAEAGEPPAEMVPAGEA